MVNDSVGLYFVPPGNPPGAPAPDFSYTDEGFHTTSFSIIDNSGNMLVCTSTIQNELGSNYVVPGRGFFLNNELTDFSTAEGINQIMGGRKYRRTALPPLNSTLGGKRPRSSMTPTIVFKDGKPCFGLGSPNGQRIIGAVIQVLLNILDWKMDIQTAVNNPRVFSSNTATWNVEPGFNKYMSLLSPQYIPVASNNSNIGVVAVVEDAGGIYHAAADSRRPASLSIAF